MHTLAHPLGDLSFNFGPNTTVIIVFAFIVVLTIIKQISRWQRDKLYYDFARAAVEKGQPVPERAWGPGDMRDMWRCNRRFGRYRYGGFVPRGLVLVAVGVGLYFAYPEGIGRWWILPLIIGVAQLIIGGIIYLTRPKDDRDPFDPMNRPQ